MTYEMWAFRETAVPAQGMDLAGFKVEATDGHIGKIDEASHDVGRSSVVVDTGPWILGKKVMLPAGTITKIDADGKKIYVDRTKEQIKNAPEYDADMRDDTVYRDKLGGYYGDTYR